MTLISDTTNVIFFIKRHNLCQFEKMSILMLNIVESFLGSTRLAGSLSSASVRLRAYDLKLEKYYLIVYECAKQNLFVDGLYF